MKTNKQSISKPKLVQEARELVKGCQSSTMSPADYLGRLRLFHSFHVEQLDSEINAFLEYVYTWKPSVICEIGTFRGGTLFLLSRVSPGDSLLISIDIELPKERQQAYQEFARERQRIYCIQGNSFLENTYTKVLRILKGKLIDLLFIDGDHSFFGVANDYVKFSPLVRPGGHIVFHDINKDSYLKTGEKSTTNVGKVPIFWEALKQTTNNFLEIINDPDQDGYGIGIIKKE